MLPPDIADAVRHLDIESGAWSDASKTAWRLVRGYVRKQQRQSQTSMPASITVAQELEQTINHAQNAMNAMKGVFGQPAPVDDEPVTERHPFITEKK